MNKGQRVQITGPAIGGHGAGFIGSAGRIIDVKFGVRFLVEVLDGEPNPVRLEYFAEALLPDPLQLHRRINTRGHIEQIHADLGLDTNFRGFRTGTQHEIRGNHYEPTATGVVFVSKYSA